jgi:hypothetical protein
VTIEISQESLGRCECGNALIFDTAAPRGGFFVVSEHQAHIALACSNMGCRKRYRLRIKLTGKKKGVMAHPDDEPKKSSSYDPMDYLDK